MVSGVVLTHNSGPTLSRTLESLAFCDELVVIDDYSTDETEDIAKAHNARVVRYALKGDFARQRNRGLSEAKGDWILFVDADEVIDIPLASEIQKAVTSHKVDGYFFRRKDTMWGRTLRFGETENVRLMRLARKGAGSWVRPVHEVWDVHGYTETLTHPILHYPHPDVRQFLSDINDYSTTNASYLYDQGVRVSWLTILAYPSAKFFVNYIWRQGWRDGTPGAVIALMMSFHSFLTRAKLWHLWQKGI